MKPQLRENSGVSQGHAKFFQQMDEDVATMRYHILLVEKFSALLLWPRKGLESLLTGRASLECAQSS